MFTAFDKLSVSDFVIALQGFSGFALGFGTARAEHE